jgi:hypothetical protein
LQTTSWNFGVGKKASSMHPSAYNTSDIISIFSKLQRNLQDKRFERV